MRPSLTTLDDTVRALKASLVVVIPALNEEASLPRVLRCLREAGLNRVRVVDNGSTDGTAAVAVAEGAEVILEPRRGYGQACWTGCQDLPKDVRWILFCNADGSDDLMAVETMLTTAATGADLVVGSRHADDAGHDHLTVPQRFGNRLATSLIRCLWGRSCADLGPLRLISRAAFEKLMLQDRGFGWMVEMEVRSVEEELRVCELPVRNFPRLAGESKISGTLHGSVKAGWIILSTIGSLLLRRPGAQRVLTWLSTLLFFAGAWIMLPQGEFTHVPVFLTGAAFMGAGYALSWSLRRPSLRLLWTVAIGVRVLLLFMQPGNDIWRYLWEAKVTLAGFNPYVLAPDAPALEPLRDTVVWPQVGHPTLTAVYPPLAQVMFMLIAKISSSLMSFKIAFTLADLAVAWLLLKRFGMSAAMLYAWNPLVMYAFAGGGHYDSLFLLPLMGALILASSRSRPRHWALSALLLGTSVAVKWASGPLALWWLWRASRIKGVRGVVTMGALMSLPLVASWSLLYSDASWHQLGPHHWVTWARSTQCLPWLLEAMTGGLFNPPNQFYILPSLALALWTARKLHDPMQAAAWFFFGLLVISPAVHGWYFTWFIAVAAPMCSWSARLIGISGFAYFWVLHHEANTGIWDISPEVRAMLWLPFILPMLLHLRKSSHHPACPAQGNTPHDLRQSFSHPLVT